MIEVELYKQRSIV